jgi:peptidoglycan pentaglycine glycine transferase (the first glycine)
MTPTRSAEWDARVRAHPRATYLQTTAWAAVKAPNGWQSRLVLTTDGAATADTAADLRAGTAADPGAQLLVRPLPVLPWSLGYAPRGPLVERWTPESAERWTGRLRAGTGLDGIGLVRMDPELEAGEASEAVVGRLRSLGWRRARDAQPHATRIVDLRADEAALWSGVRKKWRQYVNHARGAGVMVRDVDADAEPGALERFGAIMRETSLRAGIRVRALSAYRDLWAAFRPSGEAQLLFAEDAAGTTLATLLLIRCGHRVTEPYGGMTEAAADLRANYLLKWEAIRRSREAGAEEYDLWGLPTAGIAHFKEGFGGREVQYVGAWDLDLDRLGALAIRTAESSRRTYLRIRNLGRAPGPPAMDGTG